VDAELQVMQGLIDNLRRLVEWGETVNAEWGETVNARLEQLEEDAAANHALANRVESLATRISQLVTHVESATRVTEQEWGYDTREHSEP